MLKRSALLLTLVLGAGLLAGCDSAEERAEAHFESGMELLEAGDVDRALVEFRNVFQLNGFHREARATYARVVEDRGNVSEAYGQYLRLIEQYPDDLQGRKALARLALTIGNWDAVAEHVTVARDLAPEDPEVLAIAAALDYRNALRDQDLPAAATAVAAARALVASDAELINARRVLIDDQIRREEWGAALEDIDVALTSVPKDLVLHRLRLGVLEQLGREEETEAHLKALTDLFPEDENVHRMLIGWYVSRDRIDDAEAYLRAGIDPATASSDDYMQLVGFLTQYRGVEATRAEITRILAEADVDRTLFRSALAGLDFEAGDRDASIAEMEDILTDAAPSDLTRRIKVALAKMLIRTGNPVGARARVEEVLEEDPTQVEALKLKAAWLIEDDLTGDAILDLRRALDQSPRDPEIMTLMAGAYEREGNRDLLSEMLSLAVEASGGAPAETLRYAALLLSEEKLLPAEDVLVDALRLRPDHPDLLNALGNIYIRMMDWPRTEHVIATLERIGTDRTGAMANELTARKLAGQSRDQELGAFLSQLADDNGDLQSMAAVIRVRLASGDVQGALDYIAEQRAKDPDNPALRFIAGAVLALDGDAEAAEQVFRELLAEYPQSESVWIALYNLHRTRGEVEVAQTVLDDGLAAVPNGSNLQWAKAGELEFRGDVEGAIAIYEALYERNSNSLVIANNLASLISTHRDDAAALEQAYTIARRLRGTNVPAFQDTYGWISHRLGNHEEALEYLESSAKGLPNEPLAQYHLSQVYIALGRPADALAVLRTTAELVETTGQRRDILEDVQAQITKLEAEQPSAN